MFQDEAVSNRYVTIQFREENALGDRIPRDVYKQFYKDIFRLYSSGIQENVITFRKLQSISCMDSLRKARCFYHV